MNTARVLLTATAIVGAPAAMGTTPVVSGAGIIRVADLPSGAPAFEVHDAQGAVTMRIECLKSAYNTPDIVAARLLSSRSVMANIIAKNGHLALEDLGPVYFDCVPASPRAN